MCVCLCRGEYEDGERVQDKAADIRGRKFATGGNCECVCTHVHVLASFPATYVEYGVKGHPSQFYGGEPENRALYMYIHVCLYIHDCIKYMLCRSGDKIKRTSRTLQKPNQGIGEYRLYTTHCTPQTVRHRLYATDCTPQTVRHRLYATDCTPHTVHHRLYTTDCSGLMIMRLYFCAGGERG